MKLYVWCNSCSHQWHSALGMDENGVVFTQHICSDHGFILYDIIERHREELEQTYGKDFEVIYIESKDFQKYKNNSPEFQETLILNKMLGEEAEKNKEKNLET